MAHSVDNQDVSAYVDLFEAAENATPEQRKRAERARDYYDGKQWTDAEAQELRRRKQPVITVNRIKPKVDYLLGIERQSRTQPKGLPRTPQHEQDAEGSTDAIRYVAENNNFDQQRSEVWENLLVEGVGGIEVGVERKGASFEVVYKRYEFDRIFYDPHSRRRDFSDAAYLGGVVWMDADDAKARFPGKEEVINHALSSNTADTETYDDIPRVRWSDPKRNRVRVVLVYRKMPHYGWVYAWYTKAGFLKGPLESPYIDYDEQENTCPLIFTSAFVDRDGARYGYVNQLMDPQDEYNHRRSRGLHLINQRQTYGNKQSGLEPAQVKRELSKADGHVEMEGGEWGKDFGVIPTNDMSSGNLSMMELARSELDGVGPAESIMGRSQREQSGRAILAEQQGAQTEIGPILDTLRNWQKRVYRATWNRIRQYWQGETWIRVTDDQKNLKWVALNQTQVDPKTGEQVTRNNVADLDVDIILEDVPDTSNQQAETFQMFTDAVRASGQQVPLPVWMELMPGFHKKDQILELIQPDEQQQQMQAQVQELQFAQQRAEIAEKEASAAEKQANAILRQQQSLDERMSALERMVNAEVKEATAPSEIEKNQAEALNETQNALFPRGNEQGR